MATTPKIRWKKKTVPPEPKPNAYVKAHTLAHAVPHAHTREPLQLPQPHLYYRRPLHSNLPSCSSGYNGRSTFPMYWSPSRRKYRYHAASFLPLPFLSCHWSTASGNTLQVCLNQVTDNRTTYKYNPNQHILSILILYLNTLQKPCQKIMSVYTLQCKAINVRCPCQAA